MKRWIGSLLVLFFVLVIATPSPAKLSQGNFIPCTVLSKSDPGQQVKFYRIEKGDTLWDISRKYKVNLQSLMLINKLNEKSILKVGNLVKIPAYDGPVHEVRRGDTLWDIASRYHLKVEALLEANPDVSPQKLKIGKNLNIPGQEGKILAVTAFKELSRGIYIPMLLSWPLIGEITSGFGWRKSGYHHGLDIAGDIGDPIKAAGEGVVSFAGYKPVYGYTVILNHSDGKKTVYAHAKKLYVKKQEKVKTGQVIATVGVSGRTTGPHLHFEVRENDRAYDPLLYLNR